MTVFVGHLDFLKLFQRAVKRAGLPVAYSQGFNPHQLMSFGMPLALGMAGLNEYADIEFDTEPDPDGITRALNAALPDGLFIIETKLMPEKAKNAASLVCAAEYEIIFPEDESLKQAINGIVGGILASERILAVRHGKKGLAETDIRNDILDIKCRTAGETAVTAVLSAGSTRNLKPDILAGYVSDVANVRFNGYDIKYTRRELILNEDGTDRR